MTVHGAKGLEAPIVFLPDTCTTATGGPVATLFELDCLALPDGADGKPFVWSVKGTSGHRRHQRGQAGATAARNRGAQPPALRRHDARARPAVHRRLRRQERAVGRLLVRADQRRRSAISSRTRTAMPAPRSAASPSRKPPPPSRATAARSKAPPSPRCHRGSAARRRARRRCRSRWRPRASKPTRPTRPASRWSSSPRAAARPTRSRRHRPPAAQSTDHRFLRGTLTHALLQHLPTLRPEGWAKAASGFSQRAGERCRRRRARASRPRRSPFCRVRNSRRCSARAAAPRCRSSR